MEFMIFIHAEKKKSHACTITCMLKHFCKKTQACCCGHLEYMQSLSFQFEAFA